MNNLPISFTRMGSRGWIERNLQSTDIDPDHPGTNLHGEDPALHDGVPALQVEQNEAEIERGRGKETEIEIKKGTGTETKTGNGKEREEEIEVIEINNMKS